MKTRITHKTFPDAKRITFLIMIVIMFCVFNYFALPVKGFDGKNNVVQQLQDLNESNDYDVQARDFNGNIHFALQAQDSGNKFNRSEKNLARYIDEVETEASLEIEKWMFDFKIHNELAETLSKNRRVFRKINRLSTITYLHSPEPELKFESWMVDIETWTN